MQASPQARAADHRPYFFLSYAHTPRYGAGGPDPDMWVERLFRDLCGHVMAMTDLPAGAPAGFMDREIRSGEGWSERLGEVLATCRVFVPLFSPRYFASEMCGKEWYAFATRAIYHHAKHNKPADAIVPALWVPVPPEQLPGPAERLQFNHRDFGDRYVTDGLYGLIKLRIFAEEYERAVYELAKRIVSVADTAAISPGRPVDYRSAPSAFGTPGRGPRPLQVTVAAPTRHDLPEGRDPEYYGDMPQDWNPYHPDAARPIAYVTEDLVRSLNYQATVTSFDHDAGPPDAKQPPSRPEILLLDRWALQDDERRERLAAFDAEHRPWVSVVVPRSQLDHQSRAADAELNEKLEQTMPIKMGQGRAASRAAARGVPSMEAFGQILPQVVEAAAQQYLRHAAVYPPAGGRHTERPRLRGPMAGELGTTHYIPETHEIAPDAEDLDDSQS
ncbi:TIR-like protein FxsC [Streptomyces sp. WAC05374]|uniref:TIR-like protein FxsC n=1 Tax=Streptomyces sp. WAC05374 TaxID=2487420 RepID=UPI001356A449|nr:TIR-like protein FxsC [Streptomyces sp. WAC05374]